MTLSAKIAIWYRDLRWVSGSEWESLKNGHFRGRKFPCQKCPNLTESHRFRRIAWNCVAISGVLGETLQNHHFRASGRALRRAPPWSAVVPRSAAGPPGGRSAGPPVGGRWAGPPVLRAAGRTRLDTASHPTSATLQATTLLLSRRRPAPVRHHEGPHWSSVTACDPARTGTPPEPSFSSHFMPPQARLDTASHPTSAGS